MTDTSVAHGLTEQLERLAAGDQAAKAWFYRRFSPRLYRRIRSRFGSDPHLDAEELLHDLFVWCFQDDASVLTTFLGRNEVEDRTEHRLEGYLWGLVSGLVANRRRGQRRRTEPVALEHVSEPPAAGGEQAAAERDALEKLASCLRERGQRIFLYFVFRFVEGLTPREVSEVTGWPMTKVYKLRVALNRSVDRCVEQLGL